MVNIGRLNFALFPQTQVSGSQQAVLLRMTDFQPRVLPYSCLNSSADLNSMLVGVLLSLLLH